MYSETTTATTTTDKSWNNENYKSNKNATATIAIVSLMLMLCGALNSGLCLYLTAVNGTLNLYVSTLIHYLSYDYLQKDVLERIS